MNYMVCIPSPDMVSRENCEKVHNILARMSDAYKLNIVPEPVKVKQAPCPEYYRKYRIYKEIRERDGNGEAYLLQEEEDMILSVCRTPEEEALMKGCTYAYRYPSSLVLKSFREDKKEKKEKQVSAYRAVLFLKLLWLRPNSKIFSVQMLKATMILL